MDIRNFQAVKEMVMAIQASKDKPELAKFYEDRCIALLQKQLTEMRGGARTMVQVQMPAFATSGIPALI